MPLSTLSNIRDIAGKKQIIYTHHYSAAATGWQSWTTPTCPLNQVWNITAIVQYYTTGTISAMCQGIYTGGSEWDIFYVTNPVTFQAVGGPCDIALEGGDAVRVSLNVSVMTPSIYQVVFGWAYQAGEGVLD